MKKSNYIKEVLFSNKKHDFTDAEFKAKIDDLVELCPFIAYHIHLKKTGDRIIGIVLNPESQSLPVLKNFISGWIWQRTGLVDEWQDSNKISIDNSLVNPDDFECFDRIEKYDFMHR